MQYKKSPRRSPNKPTKKEQPPSQKKAVHQPPGSLENVEIYSRRIDEKRYKQLVTSMKEGLKEEGLALETATHILTRYLGLGLGNSSIGISSLNLQVLLSDRLSTPSLDVTQKASHDVTLLRCYLCLGDMGLAESHGQQVHDKLTDSAQVKEVQGLAGLLS